MEVKVNNTVIGLIQGDITEQDTEAIVNAANSQLILGGGVAGAIRRKGGESIQEECNRYAGTPTGTAVITRGGNLKASWVIHAVGPIMGEGDEDEKLKNATINSLIVADENNITSLTFPAISTGIFAFPINRCADIMLSNSINYAKKDTGLDKILFCLYDQRAYNIFAKTLDRLKSEV